MANENIQAALIGHEDTFALPISMLLSLVNSLDSDATVRAQVLEYIKTYKEKVKKKGHTAEGFYISDDGSLAFDRGLLWEAVYRGKIETYLTSAEDSYKKMLGSFESIERFQRSRNKLLGSVPRELIESRLGEGLPLSDSVEKLLSRLQGLLEKERKRLDLEK